MTKTEFTDFIKLMVQAFPAFDVKDNINVWQKILTNIPYESAYWALDGLKRKTRITPNVNTFLEYVDKVENGTIWNSEWERKWQAGVERGRIVTEINGGYKSSFEPDDYEAEFKKNNEQALSKDEVRLKARLAIQKAEEL